MKIAVITDTHFGCRGDSKLFHNFFKKFYEEIFFPYLDRNQIKQIIHCGDALDRRKYINFHSLFQCKQYFFDELKKRNIEVHMIIGNHDSTFFNTNEVNSCQLLLQEYQNIDVMIGPTEKTIGGRKILFIPWICEDNWKQTIHKIETTTANVIFGHLEIKDFEMYKNTFVLEGLDESIFSKFDVVASGHFHHRSKRRNIIYLGAPYEITWADHEDPRGFNIFDTESLEFQHIQNPYSCFKKVYYDDQRDTLDDINKLDFTDCKDVFVKLIVLNKSNPYWFEVFLEKLEKSSPAQIQVIQETLNLNTASDSKLFSETDDMSIILDRYVDQVDFDEKNKLQVFIKDLYNEAFTSIGT